jgi:hypothetical protein
MRSRPALVHAPRGGHPRWPPPHRMRSAARARRPERRPGRGDRRAAGCEGTAAPRARPRASGSAGTAPAATDEGARPRGGSAALGDRDERAQLAHVHALSRFSGAGRPPPGP